jgi:hypothetical protein
MLHRILLLIALAQTLVCCRHETPKQYTVFKLGAKINGQFIEPQDNSGFILKIHDEAPPLYLTAHHIAAGKGPDEYYRWDELEDKNPNAWIQSMEDSSYWLEVKKNLPIPNAQLMTLDIAAYRLPEDKPIGFLKPAKKPAAVGDTVMLLSIINHNGKKTLHNPALVVYATDSILVYRLLNFHMARVMSGTSGSAVVNKNNEVVSNSFAGFTIPNQEEKTKLAKEFPLINKLEIVDGKTYGVGLPAELIVRSVAPGLEVKP